MHRCVILEILTNSAKIDGKFDHSPGTLSGLIFPFSLKIAGHRFATKESKEK